MSAINEIFPNPTVKQVIFQIRFPNLFYIESKVGDFQLKVIEMFPESSLLFRKQVFFGDFSSASDLSKIQDEGAEPAKKIWNFRNDRGFELNLMSDSLGITSSIHKTYNNEGAEKFRDVIAHVVNSFLELTKVPLINRIGFRYIDECPLPSKDNDTFSRYYNSCFPIERFNIENVQEMDFKTVVDRGDCKLRYIESLQKIDDNYKLILDFDGFATNINSSTYLETTDRLHDIICDEYLATIKQPVVDIMRREE